ncbi:MAG: hypothetical protein FWG09_04210, partial [Synergistaceae bacterium]|nr:hypothetical protein [Synergistaceae bacterium]
MSDLLSQDEINALLSEDGADGSGNGSAGSSGASISPQDKKTLKDISSVFVSSLQSVFGMLTGKSVEVEVLEETCSKQAEI